MLLNSLAMLMMCISMALSSVLSAIQLWRFCHGHTDALSAPADNSLFSDRMVCGFWIPGSYLLLFLFLFWLIVSKSLRHDMGAILAGIWAGIRAILGLPVVKATEAQIAAAAVVEGTKLAGEATQAVVAEAGKIASQAEQAAVAEAQKLEALVQQRVAAEMAKLQPKPAVVTPVTPAPAPQPEVKA